MTTVSYRKAAVADNNAIWQVRSASIRALCKSRYGEEKTEKLASVPLPDDFVDVIRGREFVVAECGGIVVGFGFLASRIK